MKFNKLLSTATILYSLFTNKIEAQVQLYFETFDTCHVKCNNQIGNVFESINGIFNGINDITGQYFTVDYIKIVPEMNTVVFYNFCIKNNDFKLLMRGNENMLMYIVLDYEYNLVDIPDIELKNIKTVKLYSNCYQYPRSCKVSLLNTLDDMLLNDKQIRSRSYCDCVVGNCQVF